MFKELHLRRTVCKLFTTRSAIVVDVIRNIDSLVSNLRRELALYYDKPSCLVQKLLVVTRQVLLEAIIW